MGRKKNPGFPNLSKRKRGKSTWERIWDKGDLNPSTLTCGPLKT